jgi:hypothetical protein
MELSSDPSKDEGVILRRQVYRAGQTQNAGVPAPGSATKAGEAKPASRRKRVRRALAVIAWLLLLGVISYYLCLPNLDEVSRTLKAIREDPNLTMQQKFEKSREVYSKLTPSQGRQVFQNDFKKLHYEKNAEMQKFLKMSPEEQRTYLIKQEEERKQLGPQGGFVIGGDPQGGDGGRAMIKNGALVKGGGGGPAVGGPGGGGQVFIGAAAGGPGGRGQVFFGPGPGGPDGPPNPSQMQKTMLDNTSPETRAGMYYQRGLMTKEPGRGSGGK